MNMEYLYLPPLISLNVYSFRCTSLVLPLLHLFLNTSFVNIVDGMICFLFGESMFIKTGDNETRKGEHA